MQLRALLRRMILASVILVAASCVLSLLYAILCVRSLASPPKLTLSPAFVEATITMEDKHFADHFGFDFEAIWSAFKVNLRNRKIIYGGSTLTQQLAKNLFLTQKRSLHRKWLETFLTIALELRFAKDEILSYYVSVISYGMGQTGVTNAAKYYFGTTPDKLTISQSAILVGLVPDPPQSFLSLSRLYNARGFALQRLQRQYPWRSDIEEAKRERIEDLVREFVIPRSRGARYRIPAELCGVSMYYQDNLQLPHYINKVNRDLLNALAVFSMEARMLYGLAAIEHAGVFNDRVMAGSLRSELSQHAYGAAIDIIGFRFIDGTRITVAKGGARYQAIRELLHLYFDRVLDPLNEQRFHLDHAHAEIAPICRQNDPGCSIRAFPVGSRLWCLCLMNGPFSRRH